MQYGYFDDKNREYVITRPDTPLPWINYLGSQDFFGIISNTAGGYSFYKDARLRRLTRYRYNNVPSDSGGRYIYLRDNDSGNYWSPTWQPTRSNLDTFYCRHGLGYTRIGSSSLGIHAEVTYFIPLEDNLEIWLLELTNNRSITANLNIFSCVEFCLWDALDDASNFQRNYSTGEVEVEDGVVYHKTEYRERRNHFAYFACSATLAGFETQRDSFLGHYRGWDSPQSVESGHLSNSIAHGWSPIGAHQVNRSLAPGESIQVVYLLGYHENRKDQKFTSADQQTINKKTLKPILSKYLQPTNVQKAIADMRLVWENRLQLFQVETPDIHTNRMLNTWNAYQVMTTYNLSRAASYYESGIGRGMGFRDSNQDILGFVHFIPKLARQRILDLAATQMVNGGAYHQYQPLTKRGNDAVGSNFNDDPLWLVLSTAAYVKETADWGILDEIIPFENKPGTETSLLHHLHCSIRYTLDRLGPHGLPLIGRADWNDCLNLNTFSEEPGESFQTATHRDGTIAESILIAALFIQACKEMESLAYVHGESSEAINYIAEAENMASAVMTHGWDGAWFLRAYDHFGEKVGSHTCQEGQIFIETQGLCIMAGLGLENGMASQSLDSVNKRLATPHGIVLQQPAYTQYYLQLGEISSYPPGYKENAGIFCHTNPWIMIAETMLGHGDLAHDYYLRINPSVREKISEIHRCEPYVYAQMIAGRDAPTYGEAKNSWLTGTASWNYLAVSQYILGIRPSLGGLIIQPVIPTEWSGFSAWRYFRGVRYNITVTRLGPGNNVHLVVNGQDISGVTVPLPPDSISQVDVNVTLQ
jgi:cellobiose phosphorylase